MKRGSASWLVGPAFELLLRKVTDDFEDDDGEYYNIHCFRRSIDNPIPLEISCVVFVFAGTPLALFHVLLQQVLPRKLSFVSARILSSGGH